MEVNPNYFNGSLEGMDNIRKKVIDALKTELGVNPRVELVAPNSLPADEGKARRVFDLREKDYAKISGCNVWTEFSLRNRKRKFSGAAATSGCSGATGNPPLRSRCCSVFCFLGIGHCGAELEGALFLRPFSMRFSRSRRSSQYANALQGYKSIIVKLATRLNEIKQK